MDSKNITITLQRSALLYDIEQLAYITADAITDAPDEKIRSVIMDAGQDGNVDRVTRVMNIAFNEVVESLYAYTKSPITADCVIDDTFSEPSAYVVLLKVPLTFSTTSATAVKDLAHEYIVDRVLFDWLSITDKNEAEIWLQKSQEALNNMTAKMENRTSPRARKLSPW